MSYGDRKKWVNITNGMKKKNKCSTSRQIVAMNDTQQDRGVPPADYTGTTRSINTTIRAVSLTMFLPYMSCDYYYYCHNCVTCLSFFINLRHLRDFTSHTTRRGTLCIYIPGNDTFLQCPLRGFCLPCLTLISCLIQYLPFYEGYIVSVHRMVMENRPVDPGSIQGSHRPISFIRIKRTW